MKKLISFGSLMLLLVIVYTVMACAPGSKEGISFIENSWQTALNKAKAENKPIFVDIYATWCGPCKMLKKNTFSNREVAAFFNANYVNVSLDGEKNDGAMLAGKYRIQGYPTLFIFNKDGELLNMSTGYMEAEELMAFGKQGIKK